MNEFSYILANPSTVYIVVAEDQSDQRHIIFTTFTEVQATELVEALDEADMSCHYDYRVVIKTVSR